MPGSNEKLRVLRRIPEIRFDEELRGYNKHQVDRVLENLAPLADEVDSLVDRLSEAERRAAAAEARVMEGGGPAPSPLAPVAPMPAPPTAENFDETLSKTLLLAQRTADATVKEAQETAAQITNEAEAEAVATREAIEREAADMRAAVEAERAASIDKANRDVAAMVDNARATIDNKIAEAEAELSETHVSTRDELIAQIESLQATRDALAGDVENFEGHLAERREVIRSAIAELSEVVEDPERLRTVMPPTPLADLPDVGPTDPVDITVTSLDTLAADVADAAEADGVLAPDLTAGSEVVPDDVGSWAVPEDATEIGGESDTFVDEPIEAGSGSSWADGETTWADEPGVDEARSVGLMVDMPDDETPERHDDSEHDEPDHRGAGEPTLAHPVVDVDGGAVSEAGRRSLQDLAPALDTDQDATSDPFLDELRRVTSDDDDDEALSKFLDDADVDDDGKGGWFGRRK